MFLFCSAHCVLMSNAPYLKKKKTDFQNNVTTVTLINNNTFIIVVRHITCDVIAYVIRPIFQSFMTQKNSTGVSKKNISQMSGKSQVHTFIVCHYRLSLFDDIFKNITNFNANNDCLLYKEAKNTCLCVVQF